MAMLAMMPHQHLRLIPSRSSGRFEKIAVVVLTCLLHGVVFAVYAMQPYPPAVVIEEMSVALVQEDTPPTATKSLPQHKRQEVQRAPLEKVAVKEDLPAPVPERVTAPLKVEAAPAPVQEIAPQPLQIEEPPVRQAVLDVEPDYRARYLNNPPPPYPMVARRMGYHGKVVLNVEVLAEGRAGQVLLYVSSGYESLDNAALQTVRSWRFSPARQLGNPVTQWFLVPINFSLEG